MNPKRASLKERQLRGLKFEIDLIRKMGVNKIANKVIYEEVNNG